MNLRPSVLFATGNAASRPVRLVFCLWAMFFVVFSVKTLVDPVKASVYPAFSGGSHDWWADQPLYGNLGFYYSPTFAVLVTPFAIWPDAIGGILWVGVSMLLLAYASVVFVRDLATAEPDRWSPQLEAAFSALVGVGCLRGLWSAQSNALLLALVMLAASSVLRGRWWLAAGLLAIPVYIKVWPLAVAGLLICQWPRKLGGRFAVAMIALGLIPFLTKSPAAVVEYYCSWLNCLAERQADGVRWGGYRDAWTIWEQFRSPVDRHGYQLLQLSAGLATLAWCLWQRWQGRSTRQLLIYTIAAWSAWQLLFGPGTERLTYGLVAPAMSWGIVSCYQQRKVPGMLWAGYFVASTFALVYLIGAGHLERWLLPYTTLVMALEPLGIALFAAWLVWFAQRIGNDALSSRRSFASQQPTAVHTSRAA